MGGLHSDWVAANCSSLLEKIQHSYAEHDNGVSEPSLSHENICESSDHPVRALACEVRTVGVMASGGSGRLISTFVADDRSLNCGTIPAKETWVRGRFWLQPKESRASKMPRRQRADSCWWHSLPQSSTCAHNVLDQPLDQHGAARGVACWYRSSASPILSSNKHGLK